MVGLIISRSFLFHRAFHQAASEWISRDVLVGGADPEEAHEALGGFLQRLAGFVLGALLLGQLLVGAHGEAAQVQRDGVHDEQRPVVLLLGLESSVSVFFINKFDKYAQYNRKSLRVSVPRNPSGRRLVRNLKQF